MVTCLGDVFYPEVGERIVRLLRGLGVAVDFPAGQTCCGLPLFNSGYHAEAAAVAGAPWRSSRTPRHVVVPSGSCAWMVKHEYPGLLEARPRPSGRPPSALAGRTLRAVAVPRRSARAAPLSQSPVSRPADVPRLLPPAARAARVGDARARCCGAWAAPSSSSCRAATSAAASAARSRCGCPRSPRRSSTRSWPTSRPPAPTASSPATPAASCRCGAGCRGAAPAVRALHLAEVLGPEETSR